MDTMTDAQRAAYDAQVKLQATPVADLLRAAYSLTHRMHAEGEAARRVGVVGDSVLHADLRAQRDLIDAEIARRCER